MVGRCRAWHAIVAIGNHTHCRMRSGVACYQCPWTAHTTGLGRALHAIIAPRMHTRSDDFKCGMS
ncbi:hypothetical protein EJD97_021658 [Solanum chilense]|uniref:Uncharacterized protein n=1 Tax=Solanum chilense TaxID=4083 RepID=A0A6N2ADA8_SOLCI|nr:hypothetical protein EJD97_021658 [Solanum chilense]